MGSLGTGLLDVNNEAAVSVLQATITMLQRVSVPERNLLFPQGNLAIALQNLNRPDEALPLFRTVYYGTLAVHGATDEKTLNSANNITTSLLDNGLFAEAKQFAREQLRITQQHLGDLHTNTIHAYNNLSQVLSEPPDATKADVAEAVELIERSLKLARIALGPTHPTTQRVIRNLTTTRNIQRRFP